MTRTNGLGRGLELGCTFCTVLVTVSQTVLRASMKNTVDLFEITVIGLA